MSRIEHVCLKCRNTIFSRGFSPEHCCGQKMKPCFDEPPERNKDIWNGDEAEDEPQEEDE